MKGAGFCLLYQGFYYIEVYYIESRVYLKYVLKYKFLNLEKEVKDKPKIFNKNSSVMHLASIVGLMLLIVGLIAE